MVMGGKDVIQLPNMLVLQDYILNHVDLSPTYQIPLLLLLHQDETWM